MDHQAWLIRFFKYCETNQINPWEFDFKRFYTTDDDQSTPLELWLKYRMAVLDAPQLDNSINKQLKDVFSQLAIKSHQTDPDKVALPFYTVLNWQKDAAAVTRGETMNSFKTTFTQALVKSKDYHKTLAAIQINPNKQLDQQYAILLKDTNYQQFQLIQAHQSAIERYAQLTHSIGNFTVLPYQLNIARGSSRNFRDYWDITLQTLYNLFISIGEAGVVAWKAFVEKYYLQPFVNHDETYSVGALWHNHFNKSVYPTTSDDFKQFYHNVNLLIEIRGQWLTKQLCDTLQLKNLSFYSALDHQLKFFNEIEGIL